MFYRNPDSADQLLHLAKAALPRRHCRMAKYMLAYPDSAEADIPAPAREICGDLSPPQKRPQLEVAVLWTRLVSLSLSKRWPFCRNVGVYCDRHSLYSYV